MLAFYTCDRSLFFAALIAAAPVRTNHSLVFVKHQNHLLLVAYFFWCEYMLAVNAVFEYFVSCGEAANKLLLSCDSLW